jgi:hypothetical protein
MSDKKNKAEELREDIIDRTSKNIPSDVHEDYIKLQVRIALNNYAAHFEKEISDLIKDKENFKGAYLKEVAKNSPLIEENARLTQEVEKLNVYLQGGDYCAVCGCREFWRDEEE